MSAKFFFWLLVLCGAGLVFGFGLDATPQGMYALIAGNIFVLLALMVGVIARATAQRFPINDEAFPGEFYDEDDEFDEDDYEDAAAPRRNTPLPFPHPQAPQHAPDNASGKQ